MLLSFHYLCGFTLFIEFFWNNSAHAVKHIIIAIYREHGVANSICIEYQSYVFWFFLSMLPVSYIVSCNDFFC